MTIQFVGCYLFNTFQYINIERFTHGHERLPFQTRLLLAPLFRWAERTPWMVHYASRLAMNGYFFPHGIGTARVVEFYLDIPCLLIAGWVAVRIYRASSRRQLLGWLVYPLFLAICAVSYILHTVQNFRYVYDLPSLAFFSLGLYLIYFRKPTLLLIALFAVATLNRETTLLLIPFFVLSRCVEPRARTGPRRGFAVSAGTGTGEAARGQARVPVAFPSAGAGRVNWKRALQPEVAIPALLMAGYWAAWHVFVFHLFRHNASEYYSRIPFNLYCFERLRYYPQLFSACGFLLPLLPAFRKQLRDAQLRVWMLMIPVWYAVMAIWGILVETRVFGELLPYIACLGTLMAEESLAAKLQRRNREQDREEEEVTLIRAA